MFHLVQILLPLYNNHGQAFPHSWQARVKAELKEKFGGLTAYNRAPAEGLWEQGCDDVKDQIVIYEVMIPEIDKEWWSCYRETLEDRFSQDEIIIRSLPMQQL
jgi:hypothetical protein